MADEIKPKDINKFQQEAKERAALASKIARQWHTFSKTDAYEDLIQYINNQHDMLISYAKERVMPSPAVDGEQIILDNETANSLLQNARGSDIVKSYVEGYVNFNEPTS